MEKIKYLIDSFPKSDIQASEGEDEGIYPFYTSSMIIGKRINKLLYNTEGITMGTGGSASVNYSSIPFSTSTDCFNFKLKKGNTKFLYYYIFASLDKINDIYFEGMGLKHLQKEKFLSEKIVLPSLEKQNEIVGFLDKQVKAINGIIQDEQSAIKELIDYKKSLVEECVFQGIKKEVLVANRCSLGYDKLPKSWSKDKLVRLASCKSGSTPDRNNSKYWDNPTISWMASGEVNKEYVFETDEKISELGFRNSSLRVFPVNTVMLALNGQGKTKGMASIIKIPTTCNQSLLGMTCFNKLHYRYLYYYFKAVYKTLRSQVGDKSREGLSGDFIKSLIIPLPNINEQIQICDFLDERYTHINRIIELKTTKIEKLKEYKKSLIFEWTTGRRTF